MSQNYSILPALSQNNSRDEIKIGCRELFDKCWLLCFGNSEIRLTSDLEEESRWTRIGKIYVFCRVERNKYNSSDIKIRWMRITAPFNTLFFDNEDVKYNKIRIFSKGTICYILMDIFDMNKQHIKKIKHLQKRLLSEIDKFHDKLDSVREKVAETVSAYEDYTD